MRTSPLSRRVAALAIAAIAVLGLTACTGAPAGTSPTASGGTGSSTAPQQDGGPQSTAEACQLVQDTIEDATSEFENVEAEDPTAVVDAMEVAAERLGELSSKITNEEVAPLLPSLEAMFAEMSEVMSAIVEGDTSRLGELEELATSFQSTSEQFQELCAP